MLIHFSFLLLAFSRIGVSVFQDFLEFGVSGDGRGSLDGGASQRAGAPGGSEASSGGPPSFHFHQVFP